jgi:hypothetical protein
VGGSPHGAHNRIGEADHGPGSQLGRSGRACVEGGRGAVDGGAGELRAHRLSGEIAEVVAFCAGLRGPTKAAYAAGPAGFGLARALDTAGVGCAVAAPGKIERPRGIG